MAYIGEDKDNKALAEELGYQTEQKTKWDAPLFIRGPVHIWPIKDGWRAADLLPKKVAGVDELHYQNHRTHKSLKVALRLEAGLEE